MLKGGGLDVFQHLNVHGYGRIGGGKMRIVGNVAGGARAHQEKYGQRRVPLLVMREMVRLDAGLSEERWSAAQRRPGHDLGNLVSRATTLLAGFVGRSRARPARALRARRACGLEEAWLKARRGIGRP